jgi:hypothetical protein
MFEVNRRLTAGGTTAVMKLASYPKKKPAMTMVSGSTFGARFWDSAGDFRSLSVASFPCRTGLAADRLFSG